MKRLNAIVYDGKVYEAIAESDCKDCAFDKNVWLCSIARDLCTETKSSFQYSQELTDKINDI